MRSLVRRCLLSLACVCLFAACGQTGDVPRVRVTTFSGDGAPPDGLVFVPVATPDAALPMRAVGEGLYEVPGAPEGPFTVRGPEGWSTAVLSPLPPQLVLGDPPPGVRLVRPHTAYLFCLDPAWRPGEQWGAARRMPDGTTSPVPVEVQDHEQGRVVSLRFRPEDWRGELVVLGHLAPGGLERLRPQDLGTGPLTKVLPLEAPEDGSARVSPVGPAQQTAVQVGLVPAGPASAALEGTEVEIQIPDLPLDLSWTRRAHEGVARLSRFPVLGVPLRILLPASGTRVDVATAELRRLETIYVLAGDDLRDVPVPGAEGAPWSLAIARPEGAPAYGLVETVGGETPALRLPPVRSTVLLEREGRWARLEVGRDGDVDGPVRYEDAVVVQGNVQGLGAPPFAALRLFRREGADRVTGHGFAIRLQPPGSFSVRLPAGDYDAEVVTSRGDWRRPRPIQASEPGSHHHVTLRAP